jgi:hypothetical protein
MRDDRIAAEQRGHGDAYGVAVITSDWSDVPGRLATLLEQPNAGSVFGVNGHHWLAEPPLTEDELTEVESQLGIELPDEYRAFLLQASRGGAGPAYGLSRFAGSKAVGGGKETARISQNWRR